MGADKSVETQKEMYIPKGRESSTSAKSPTIWKTSEWGETVDTSRLKKLGGGQFGEVFELDEATVIKVIRGNGDL